MLPPSFATAGRLGVSLWINDSRLGGATRQPTSTAWSLLTCWIFKLALPTPILGERDQRMHDA